MIITDNVLLSRLIGGQAFSVLGEWFYMDGAKLLYHLPPDLMQYIREIEALQSIGKVLYFNKAFLDGVNISTVRHTALARRLLDPTKDSLQLHLSHGKSIFIKDAALPPGNGTLRVRTHDNQIAADIAVINGKPVSVSETAGRPGMAGSRAAIPYGYLCRGLSFAPLEVKVL
jgi:hypothetical protein